MSFDAGPISSDMIRLEIDQETPPIETDASGAPGVEATPVEEAVAEVEGAQRQVEQLEELRADGNRFARAELGDARASLQRAQNNLEEVVETEISDRQNRVSYLPIPSSTSYQIAAGQILDEYEGSAAGRDILQGTINELTVAYEARQTLFTNLPGTAKEIADAENDETRLELYTDALAEGDEGYRNALTNAVFRADPSAPNTWLNPAFINEQAERGALTRQEHRLAAQGFVSAYNDGLFHTDDVAGAVNVYPLESELQAPGLDSFAIGFRDQQAGFGPPADHFTPIADFAELNQLLDAAGTTSETQQFRRGYAEHLNDTYVQNDAVLDDQVREVAAAGAALILSGDSRSPELSQDFLVDLKAQGGNAFDTFLESTVRGSFYFSQEALEVEQNLGNGLEYGDLAEIAQSDALAELVDAFADAGPDAQQPEVAEIAVDLARVPDDHSSWVDDGGIGTEQRREAWTDLFVNHSTTILDALTDPSGLPGTKGVRLEAGFKGRAEDLGALLRFTQVSFDSGDVATALNEYNQAVRDRIENTQDADTTIAESRRLGFLGAAITESVNQGFEEYADKQAQRQALAGFFVDLTFSAIPASSLIKGVANDGIKSFIEDNIENGAAQKFFSEALQGFSGTLIGEGENTITGPAREHILDQVGNDELGESLIDLAESNAFISEQLFADLPAPGYTPDDDIESGRADVINAVQTAYEIAFEALRD